MAIKASKREVSNWDLGDSAIDLPALEPHWREHLHIACAQARIPWREPGWHLAINDNAY